MTRQTNFGGGEIAPMSWGRTDRNFFARGLRTMRNFFATKQHGSAVSRPGSTYICKTRDDNGTARLLPFVYSDSQSFVVEMGIYGAARNIYFRFYTGGVQVQAFYLPVTAETAAFTVGAILSGATSGARGEIVGIITGPLGNHFLQLNVTSGAFIAGEAIADSAGGAATSNGTGDWLPLELQAGTTSAGFDIMKVKYAQLGAVLVLTHPHWPPMELRQHADVGSQKKFSFANVSFAARAPYFDIASVGGSYPVITTVGAAGPTTPNREWIYLVTLTVQDWATGRVFETLPWRVTEQWDEILGHRPATFSPDNLSIYLENPLTLQRGLHIDGPSGVNNVRDTSYKVICANYYRGRGPIPGGVYGYVGSTEQLEFVDLGKEPDYFTPPPLGTHPFKVTKQDGTVEYEHPAAVAWFQDRLVFGGTPRRPATLFTSETGAFDRWDLNAIVHNAGEALVFELAARKFEQIVHLVSHQKLIVGTTSSAWTVGGAQGPLDFDSVDARVIDEVGMTHLQPLMIGGRVIFARTKGAGVRGLLFDGNYGTYSGVDLSEQADHLFVGDSVGAVGAATNKEIIDWAYAEDPWGLVWAVRADGMLLSLTLSGNEYGWARHDGEPTSKSAYAGYGTPAAYKRVCSVPEGDEDAVYVIVQRAIGGSLGTNCVERMTSRVRRGGRVNGAYDDGCLDCSVVVDQPVPALGIVGLDHLEGESVYVSAVGNSPQGPFTVQGGAIQLGTLPVVNHGLSGVILYVGLKFTPDLELLDVVTADTRLKQKRVTRVGFEVDQSAGIKLGTDFDHLTSSRPHTVADGWNAPVPRTQVISANPQGNWDVGGRACLRQTLPLPVTVVGAVRELDVGG